MTVNTVLFDCEHASSILLQSGAQLPASSVRNEAVTVWQTGLPSCTSPAHGVAWRKQSVDATGTAAALGLHGRNKKDKHTFSTPDMQHPGHVTINHNACVQCVGCGHAIAGASAAAVQHACDV
jgi:hypothetical protein